MIYSEFNTIHYNINQKGFLLTIGARLHCIFHQLTSDQRESVFIIDDTPYDRSRSKKVELLSRVFDHSTGRYLKGFRLLAICWPDGDLFYACCQELDDIGFVEAFHRIMTLAVEQLRHMGTFCGKTAMAFFDTAMATVLKYVNLSKNRVTLSIVKVES